MNPNLFLSSHTSSKWKRIGIQKRAGVALPLFSVYSKSSIGTGEIPDIRLLIDWCRLTGNSVIQLLPLNELGNDNAPYNSVSSFAIEPMYISLRKLKDADLRPFRSELKKLKNDFPAGTDMVNYDVRKEKRILLRKIFSAAEINKCKKFTEYFNINFHWLKYYCLFRILSDLYNDASWEEWDLKHKYIAPFTSEKLLTKYQDEVNFLCWIQWQLYEQLLSVKRYARKNKVLLMGDIPFLASRNSADVWAYKNYFKLQLSSGAPPDMYFSKGQRWGMPPYNWDNIVADKYGYIKQKLKYAGNFYDMYRIDHFVGLFRLWITDLKTPVEEGGTKGMFDPPEESYWEEHGKNILRVMIESSSMLPCAEDLGTVPHCSDKVLKEFGITGIDVQRWQKNSNDGFKEPGMYRVNSVATISTHDSSSFPSWWENEAGTTDEVLFKKIIEKYNLPPDKYDELKRLLFETGFSGEGRLKWKEGIKDINILLNILGLSHNNAEDIIELYSSAYNEKKYFLKYLRTEIKNEDIATVDLVKTNLEKISSASSIFSIQLLTEFLYLDGKILERYKGSNYRINFPGTVNKQNWSIVMPVSLEELNLMEINNSIKEINLKSGRI